MPTPNRDDTYCVSTACLQNEATECSVRSATSVADFAVAGVDEATASTAARAAARALLAVCVIFSTSMRLTRMDSSSELNGWVRQKNSEREKMASTQSEGVL